MPDIAHDEEGRSAFGWRNGGDVFAGLVVGALEDFIERQGAAFPMAGFLRGVRGNEIEQRAGIGSLGKGALLGL
jgi:hypothetical protein